MNARDSRRLGFAIAVGLVVLLAAFVPSPLRLLDAFDETTKIVQPRPPALKLIEPPPIGAFAEIVQRPLFNAERKPDPGSAAPVSVAVDDAGADDGGLPGFRLVGIVTDSVTQRAIVERDGAPSLRLAPGDFVEGWRVKTIDRKGIVATKNSKSVRIVIPKTRD